MANYQRSDVPFPAGSSSLMVLFGPAGDATIPVLANLNVVLAALFAGSGTQIDLSLGDGTTLRMLGSWSVAGFSLSGAMTSFEHISGADVLETIDGFSAPFSASFNIFTQQYTADFSSFAQLYWGDDHVNGGALGDLLNGFGGDDTIVGNGGSDTLFGGNGSDDLHGATGNDKLHGGSDDDQLYGDKGRDRLYGDAGSDTMSGGPGNDALLGGSGLDLLKGDAGNDLLNGGSGNDRFVFADGFGHDTVVDFGSANGEDIDLSAVTAITGFADLVHHHLQADDVTGFALIADGANTILLDGITVDEIGIGLAYSGKDFVF